MDSAVLWAHLKETAAKLGVEVRLERLRGQDDLPVRGGLCRLGRRLVIFVEQGQDRESRCRQLGRGLLQLDLEQVYLKPVLRDFFRELADPTPATQPPEKTS